MRKTIPTKQIVVCDKCLRECGTDAPYKMGTSISIQRAALDYLGDAAADGSIKLDLCDTCSNIICNAINNTIIPPNI